MRIAIASGKGGTGKTTVAANLSVILADQGHSPALVDCDVEEPNSHIFLTPTWDCEEQVAQRVPVVRHDTCLGSDCRRCIESCRFRALIWMGGEVMTFPELCHGCGLCAEVCPSNGIGWAKREVGLARVGTGRGVRSYGGLLRVGEPMAVPLIRAVKRMAEAEPLQIWDCPPGTACTAVASLRDSDFVLLVTEPTAFGLHDLTLAVALVRDMRLPFGVVINRAGMGDERVERYLEKEGIRLLAGLPHSREAARAGADGRLLVEAMPSMRADYEGLWRAVSEAQAREVAS